MCTQTSLWWEAPPGKWRQVEDRFQKHICHLNGKGYIETHSGLIRILLWEEPKPQTHRLCWCSMFFNCYFKGRNRNSLWHWGLTPPLGNSANWCRKKHLGESPGIKQGAKDQAPLKISLKLCHCSQYDNSFASLFNSQRASLRPNNYLKWYILCCIPPLYHRMPPYLLQHL